MQVLLDTRLDPGRLDELPYTTSADHYLQTRVQA